MATFRVTMMVLAIGFSLCVQARDIQKPANIKCILVFGDSSVDPGNNNRLNTSFKANYLPYGKNLFNGKFPGRFTNGRLPTDMTAESLGIKPIIPAFLDPKLKKEDLLTGVSFASSASGYDNLTAELTNVLPVYKQLEYFQHYKIHLRQFVGAKTAHNIVQNAVFVISMGTNDFIQNYFLEPTRSKQFTVEQYTDYLANCMTQDIREMHRLGATKLVVVGVPPLGCMPLIKTLMSNSSTQCVETYNKAAYLMNQKIQAKVAALRRSLAMKIGYEDIYTIFRKAIKMPKRYGIENSEIGPVADQGGSGVAVVIPAAP